MQQNVASARQIIGLGLVPANPIPNYGAPVGFREGMPQGYGLMPQMVGPAIPVAYPQAMLANAPQMIPQQFPPGWYDQPTMGTGKTMVALKLLNHPTIQVDEDFIRGLLTRDFVSRKIRQWRLLNDEEMQDMLTIAEPWLQGTFGNLNYNGNLHIVGRKYLIGNAAMANGIALHLTWFEREAETIQKLEENYPLITALLEEYHGRLIAAGGAINFLLHRNEDRGSRDIDLFFIDPEVESDRHCETAKQEKATAFLLEVVSYLVDRWLNRPGDAYVEYDDRVAYVFRGEFVTTVYLASSYCSPMKYQFIHRVYPNIGSVLGGFDLGPCMIAFTGRKIVATELGAWSALAKTIIVDTSRRSTSFEHRLTKYANFCHLIFPGLPRHIPPEEIMHCLNPEQLDQLIHETIESHGYCFGEIPTNGPNDYDGGGFDLIKDESDKQLKIVTEKLKKKAAKYGYEVSKLRLTQLSPLTITVENINKRYVEYYEFKLLLTKLAYEHGYILDINDLVGYHREISRYHGSYVRQQPQDRHSRYLTKRKPILKLTKLEINYDAETAGLSMRTFSRGRYWNVRPNLDMRYEVMTDYEGEMVVWPTNKANKETTDYADDSTMWPQYMVAANFNTWRACENASASLVSICCFKNAKTMMPIFEDGIINTCKEASLLVMCEMAIDVDTLVAKHNRNVDNTTPVTSRQVLMDILVKSIVEPQLGDFGKVANPDKPRTIRFECDEIDRIEASRLRLVGIKWILRNPGTQWTSSINPIVKHPRDWYGWYYLSYRIGNQEIETCLRLARLRRGNPFSRDIMGRDVFRLILIAIFML